MLIGRSTQHILQMLKDPQGIEYNARANQPHFLQSSVIIADNLVIEGPLQEPVQRSTLALEAILKQARQFEGQGS